MPDAGQLFTYTTTGTGGGTLFQGGTFFLDDDPASGTANTLTFTFTGADATGTKTITEAAAARLDTHEPRLLEGHDHHRHRPRQHRPRAG